MPALDVSLLQPASSETIIQTYVPQVKDDFERAKLKCIASFGLFEFFTTPNASNSFVLALDKMTGAYRVFAESVPEFLEGMRHVKVAKNITPKDKFLIDDIKTSLLPAMKGVLESLGLQWKAGDTYACFVCLDDKLGQDHLQEYVQEMAQDIKPGNPSLAEALYQIYIKKYSGYSLDYFKCILEKYPSGVYYDETGEPVGFTGCHSDGQSFIQIKEGHRNKGLGFQLACYNTMQFRKHGIPIFSYCLKDNISIQRLLNRSTVMERRGDVNFLFASPKPVGAKL